MIKIDLHMHTTRYSQCSNLSPEELPVLLPFTPLNGVVITEHDHLWSLEEIAEIQKTVSAPFKFYRGIEVSCKEGHYVVIGLDSSEGLSHFMPLKQLIPLAKEQQAAVIMAHPGRFSDLPADPPAEEWLGIDAIEVMSTNIRQEIVPSIKETYRILKKPQVAGSDSHVSWSPGMYATEFPELPANEKELARMIREGLGIPWANQKHIKNIHKQIPESHFLWENPLLLST